MIALEIVGSICSILGLAVSLYVLWREVRISKELHQFKVEEERWRDGH